MTESNQGPATPGTAARCEVCNDTACFAMAICTACKKPLHECSPDSYPEHWRLAYEHLKAENASLLESLRAANEYLHDPCGLCGDTRHDKTAHRRWQAAEQRAEAVEKALTELLRLYDWRFVLAAREGRSLTASLEFVHETRRLLRQYGEQKKAAWEAARAALQEAAKGRAPQAPLEAVEAEGQEAIAARAALHDEERSAPPQEGEPSDRVGRLTIVLRALVEYAEWLEKELGRMPSLSVMAARGELGLDPERRHSAPARDRT